MTASPTWAGFGVAVKLAVGRQPVDAAKARNAAVRDEVVSQSAAAAIVAMQLSPWVLLVTILGLVIGLGFFLPPVSIILMTAPIILPPLKAAGFDLVWFGVVMTITMEMGLIHPPVGLNIFVIKNIAPDIPLSDIIWGTLPFVILMGVAIVVLCLVPGIAMWLPDLLLPTTR